jgi:hypothetical protein
MMMRKESIKVRFKWLGKLDSAALALKAFTDSRKFTAVQKRCATQKQTQRVF